MKSSKAGVTLIELILSMLIAPIVMLAAIMPLLQAYKIKGRFNHQATLQASVDMCRDFIVGKIRRQINGPTYISDINEAKEESSKGTLIRLGDPGYHDYFKLENGNLIYDEHGEDDDVILLSDVTAFETKLVGTPAIHMTFAIQVEREGVAVYREFAAAGRNELSE